MKQTKEKRETKEQRISRLEERVDELWHRFMFTGMALERCLVDGWAHSFDQLDTCTKCKKTRAKIIADQLIYDKMPQNDH